MRGVGNADKSSKPLRLRAYQCARAASLFARGPCADDELGMAAMSGATGRRDLPRAASVDERSLSLASLLAIE